MRKINWKPKGSNKHASARIGSISLSCHLHYPSLNWLWVHTNDKRRCRWFAVVSTSEHKGYYVAEERKGPIRHSLSKAKEDAIRLARELLLDHQAALDIEKKNFDL